jgi:hypothetical protein
MVGMRIRAAGIMAIWVIVAVSVSTVMTCVPGSMRPQASEMLSCMGDEQSSVSSGVTASSDAVIDCCTHHEPWLTAAKADLLKAPVQHVLPWLAWVPPAAIVRTTLSITAESPPELTSTVGPPTYIVLSALRV